MKSIYLKDYNKNMGILIDIKHPLDYKENHHKDSINIYYDSLLMNYKTLLNKNIKYYIVCKNGKRSKEVTRILSFYGYDVTNVIN